MSGVCYVTKTRIRTDLGEALLSQSQNHIYWRSRYTINFYSCVEFALVTITSVFVGKYPKSLLTPSVQKVTEKTFVLFLEESLSV